MNLWYNLRNLWFHYNIVEIHNYDDFNFFFFLLARIIQNQKHYFHTSTNNLYLYLIQIWINSYVYTLFATTVNNQCTSSRYISISNSKDKLYLFPFYILCKNDYVSFENKAVNHDGKYLQTVEYENKIIHHRSLLYV